MTRGRTVTTPPRAGKSAAADAEADALLMEGRAVQFVDGHGAHGPQGARSLNEAGGSDVRLRVSGDVRRMRLRPDDILVIMIQDDPGGDDILDRIARRTEDVLRAAGLGNRVIVAGPGVQVEVVSPGP